MSRDETDPEQKVLDRRTRRTRRQLKEALFALILEKGYDAVTIEDITQRADLGRTTFYLHYRDKEELLLEAFDSTANELIARLPLHGWYISTPPVDMPGLAQDGILIAFHHAAENAQLYRIILRGEGARRANQRMHNIIRQTANSVVSEMAAAGKLELQVPPDVFASYFAGALLATITWWLEADTLYPPEQMAEMFRMMFFQGGRRVLGIEPLKT